MNKGFFKKRLVLLVIVMVLFYVLQVIVSAKDLIGMKDKNGKLLAIHLSRDNLVTSGLPSG